MHAQQTGTCPSSYAGAEEGRRREETFDDQEEGETFGRRGPQCLSAEHGSSLNISGLQRDDCCAAPRGTGVGERRSRFCAQRQHHIHSPLHCALPNHRKAAAAFPHKQVATQRFVLFFLHFALCIRAEKPP